MLNRIAVYLCQNRAGVRTPATLVIGTFRQAGNPFYAFASANIAADRDSPEKMRNSAWSKRGREVGAGLPR
jgi:hypothetical protein